MFLHGANVVSFSLSQLCVFLAHGNHPYGIPGGLGLKLLCEFIDLNGGCIQIVSDAGYWRRSGRQTAVTKLNHPFPGTVVSVEINTADTESYSLASELTTEDIF